MKFRSPRLAQLCVLLLCSSMVGAQTPVPSTTQRITPNWSNVDIGVVADAVGAATGITFILDPRVRTPVTLVNSRPMTTRELYSVFLNILAVNNLVAVRSGTSNVVKIVPEANARNMATNVLPDNLNMNGDEMVTVVLEVKNINAVQFGQAIRQLLGQSGALIPVTGTNTIVVMDRASNVARMQDILAVVDKSSNASYAVIPLKFAIASDLAKTITALLTGPADAAAGPAPRISSEDRTNSIIVSGEPAQRLRVADMVATLDVPVDDGGGTQIITLKYADAEELATTLKAQITGVTPTTGGAATTAAPASVAAIADRSANIQASKATNKLIITAPPRTMTMIKSIIAELDVAPAQVHIEAIIAEISDQKAASLGVNWAVFSNEDGTSVPAGGFISPIGGTSIVDLAQLVDDAAGAVANGVGIPQGATFAVGRMRDNGLNLAAMLRAIRTEGNSNIVSLPNVTTTNNQEAVMKSGKKVPFLTGSYTNTGGNGGGVGSPFQTLDRQDVGTTLKVTPQIISDNDEVILKIDLVNSALLGDSGDAGSPITSENSVVTSVRVQSGSTIVIGGMIKADSDDSESRVPFLSRIPILGELFRTRGGKREKSNLMIFIQPRILRDAVQANAETNARLESLRQAQLMQNNEKELFPLLPFQAAPELPPSKPPEPPVTSTNPVPATP